MFKNITFSADTHTIYQARKRARNEKKSLNQIFRIWLTQYASGKTNSLDFKQIMKQLQHIKANKHFSRDKLNER